MIRDEEKKIKFDNLVDGRVELENELEKRRLSLVINLVGGLNWKKKF